MIKNLIVLCNAWNRDEVGGAYKIATDLSIYCSANGWNVHYVCASEKNIAVMSKPVVEDGVRLWRYKKPSNKSPLERIISHKKGCEQILKGIFSGIDDQELVCLNGHTHLQYYFALFNFSSSISNFSRVRKSTAH